jgi:hypothetical protein
VASRNPEHLGLAQQVLNIPFKRAPTGHRLLWKGRDRRNSPSDRSDHPRALNYALLATMFNTGARVQEIADLRASDLQLARPFRCDCSVREEGALLSAVAATAALLRSSRRKEFGLR